MNPNPKLKLKAIVQSRSEASEHMLSPGDAVLIERGTPRWLLLSCPCGCGAELPINLDSRAGPAWRLYRGQNAAVTLYPSVWRESGCESHFIIWRDRILLFGDTEDDSCDSSQSDEPLPTREAVIACMPNSGLITFFEIAEVLEAIPWDVLRVCRQLVHSGRAREGEGKERGSFSRNP